MAFLNDKSRLNLQEMIRDSDAEDNTDKIRSLRHSQRIKREVDQMVKLKRKYRKLAKTDYKKYERLVTSHCNFLWTNYTNIFNRLLKDELDINILYKILEKLREIEDEGLSQTDASIGVGQLLKELYIDSALKRSNKLKAVEDSSVSEERKPVHDITWAAFKRTCPGRQ